MKDQEVTGRYPVAGREQGTKFPFNAGGVFGRGPAKALCQAGNMGIDNHRRDPEGGREGDIGGLAPDTGEGRQCGQGGRNLAVMAFLQALRTADQVPGLMMIKTGGADQLFDFKEGCPAEGGSIRVAGKESRGDEVHPSIRTLGGEDSGHQQLKGGAMRQGTPGARIELCQPV